MSEERRVKPDWKPKSVLDYKPKRSKPKTLEPEDDEK